MRKFLKIFTSLGIKGVLCIVCLAIVSLSLVFSLVTYTSTVNISPFEQLSVGQPTASWTIYVNEVNQVRYIPGEFTEPTLNPSDTSTYAFKVVTDTHKVCAVKLQLASAMDPAKFSNFEVTVLSSTGGAWTQEQLYTGATGSNTKAYVDGLVQGDAAYVHQELSTTSYYLVQVTYSYDLLNQTSTIPVTFQFTPLPQDSF